MKMVQTSSVCPPHEVRDTDKLSALVAAMTADGWSGRALLVVARGDRYVAWTGSHRLAAARAAGVTNVPVVVVSEDLEAQIADELPRIVDAYGALTDGDALREIAEIARSAGADDVAQLAELE